MLWYTYILKAATTGNEVDDTIRDLKKISGFSAYLILNNDGSRSLPCFLILIL